MRSLALVGAATILSSLIAESSSAQIVRRLPGRGIAIRAPYAPPINVRAPLPVRPVRPFLFRRPPVTPETVGDAIGRAAVAAVRGAVDAAGAPQATSPNPSYAAPATLPAQAAARPTNAVAAQSAQSRSYPTAADLRGMDDSTLLNAVLDLFQSLQADVGQFNTGGTWQQYFKLPEDALPAPSGGQVKIGLNALQATLARFEKIAADNRYLMISGLPSFVAARASLEEAVRRFGERRIQAASATTPPTVVIDESAVTGESEELPAPPPSLTAPANARSDERSVLID